MVEGADEKKSENSCLARGVGQKVAWKREITGLEGKSVIQVLIVVALNKAIVALSASYMLCIICIYKEEIHGYMGGYSSKQK